MELIRLRFILNRHPSSMLLFSLLLLIGNPFKGDWRNVVEGHGRLIEPPSRSTMWRYGFATPPNYNDHELYCGGFTRQWRDNGGKCGICGDPWNSKQPRANEAGGMYGRGVLVRKYQADQAIKIRVELTANHAGYFEFRVCPNNNPAKVASQRCLDQYILEQSHGKGPKYRVSPGNRIFEMQYDLPKGLTCQQCVMQWRYIAGNNWGECKNGTGAVGCGPQEEFRACSDVAITNPDGSADNTPNKLVDPEVYIPKKSADVGQDDDKYNEIDVDSKDSLLQSGVELDHEIEVESVVIIVFVTLITVLLFFTGIYFYYVRGGKQKFDAFITEHKRLVPKFGNHGASSTGSSSSLSSIRDRLPSWTPPTKMPKMPVKMPQFPKMDGVNWPLTNVPINRLPRFLNGEKSVHVNKIRPTVVAPVRNTSVNITGPIPKSSSRIAAPHSTNAPGDATRKKQPAPKPPPRIKKQQHEFTSGSNKAGTNITRLATVGARGHSGQSNSGPAPVSTPCVPILEIGAPTSVTINGVTVTSSSSEDVEIVTNLPNQPNKISHSPSNVSTFKDPASVNIDVKASSIRKQDSIKPSKEGKQQVGWFVPAQPAIANEDIPDSMASELHLPSLPETSVSSPATSPPPLPTCPPPEFDDDNESALV